MQRKSQSTRDELWECPGCGGWYSGLSDTEDTNPDGVCDACYEEATQTVLNVAAEVLESPGIQGTLTSRQVRLPYAQVRLPSLSTDDALTLVDILERIVEAIWRGHGDAMAEEQASRGEETPRPPEAEWACPDRKPKDKIF